jgi:hypothetical protein
MEKKFTLSACLILLAFLGFSQCPNFFKRNNGNGTCGGQSEIRMYFPACVSNPPVIDSIYTNNVKADLTINAPDGSKCAGKGYVSYCFSGNLPPASNLHVFFTSVISGVATHISCFVPEGNVAPVVLSDFETQRSGSNTVNVTWKTQQEVNASGFEIQRSFNNSTFETIGFVASRNSNSNTSQFYTFTDNSNNSKDVSYYRIKMIDKDNSYSLSSIKLAKGMAGKADFTIFPNPSAGNAKVTVNDLSEPIDVMILDNSGRLIKQTTLIGKNSVEINNLQKGGYFIKITGKESGSSSTKKLSVIN